MLIEGLALAAGYLALRFASGAKPPVASGPSASTGSEQSAKDPFAIPWVSDTMTPNIVKDGVKQNADAALARYWKSRWKVKLPFDMPTWDTTRLAKWEIDFVIKQGAAGNIEFLADSVAYAYGQLGKRISAGIKAQFSRTLSDLGKAMNTVTGAITHAADQASNVAQQASDAVSKLF